MYDPDLDTPAGPLDDDTKESLLFYASEIAENRADHAEVRQLAEALELHLVSNCATQREQHNWLRAMRRVFRNRPGHAQPYHGRVEEFLEAAEDLYGFLAG